MTQSGELRAGERDWADPNIANLINLLLREGNHSGVWFGDQLIEAATLLNEARFTVLASRPSIRDEALETAAQAVEALDMQFHDTFLDGRDEAVRAIRALKSGG